MDLLSALRVLVRQWLVLSIALSMVAAAVYVLAERLPPTFQVTATLLVLPPRQGGVYLPPDKQTPGKVLNPYLSFDSSDYVLARLATHVLSSPETRTRLSGMGATGSYQVTTSSEEPIVDIVVTDSDAARTVKTRDALVEIAQAELATRQQASGAPKETWATTTPVVLPQNPTETTASVKVLIAAAALGVVGAVGLAFAAEGMSISRRRRRSLLNQEAGKPQRANVQPPRFNPAAPPPPPLRPSDAAPNNRHHQPSGMREPGSRS